MPLISRSHVRSFLVLLASTVLVATLALARCTNRPVANRNGTVPNDSATVHMALFRVGVSGRFGYIDRQGNVIVKPQYPHCANRFVEGVAWAQSDSTWLYGYIDSHGEWVIEPTFEMAQSFSEELAAVRRHGLIGYIDRESDVRIPFRYVFAWPFHNGRAIVGTASAAARNAASRFEAPIRPTFMEIDRDGTITRGSIKDGLQEAEVAAAGRLRLFSEANLCGYRDEHGNVVIPATFLGG